MGGGRHRLVSLVDCIPAPDKRCYAWSGVYSACDMPVLLGTGGVPNNKLVGVKVSLLGEVTEFQGMDVARNSILNGIKVALSNSQNMYY